MRHPANPQTEYYSWLHSAGVTSQRSIKSRRPLPRGNTKTDLSRLSRTAARAESRRGILGRTGPIGIMGHADIKICGQEHPRRGGLCRAVQSTARRRNLISLGDVFFAIDAAKENSVTRLGIVLTIAAVLAGAAPVSAQQQPAPAPSDQGNGNWDPPPVTKPTTQR